MTVAGASGSGLSTLATWPRAWTPASVRLAPTTRTSPADQRAQRLEDQALHGRRVRLDLPAVVGRAVVGQRSARRTDGASGSIGYRLGVVPPSSSAICTALVAAPLRSWSPTTQKFSAALVGEVLADPPDEAVVLALDGHRHRVARLVGIVHDAEAGEALEELARPLDRDLLLGLRVDRDGVGGEDRHPHGRGRDAQVRGLEDLPHLVHELHLLARVAARRRTGRCAGSG